MLCEYTWSTMSCCCQMRRRLKSARMTLSCRFLQQGDAYTAQRDETGTCCICAVYSCNIDCDCWQWRHEWRDDDVSIVYEMRCYLCHVTTAHVTPSLLRHQAVCLKDSETAVLQLDNDNARKVCYALLRS